MNSESEKEHWEEVGIWETNVYVQQIVAHYFLSQFISIFLHTHTHTIVCMPEYICIALVSGCCWLTPISEAASKYTSIDESSQNNCVYCSIESILLQKEAEIETEQETVISCIAMPMKLWLYRNFEMHVHCTCLRFHIRSAEYLRACWFDLTTNKQVY